VGNLSAQEVKEKDLATLGPELGSVYSALSNECTWAFMKWHEYVQMFGAAESRIDLLNEAAPQFFRVIQDVLWEDSLLHISRLTDQATMGRNKNLSVQALPALINEPDLKEEVEGLVETAVKKAAFARDWRNRRIAHRDLGLALAESPKPLKEASRLKVKEALAAIAAVLNAIDRYHRDSTTAYELGKLVTGAEHMMYVLRDGIERERKRRRDLEKGEYNPQDWTETPI
jgi:hypothetical protein